MDETFIRDLISALREYDYNVTQLGDHVVHVTNGQVNYSVTIKNLD